VVRVRPAGGFELVAGERRWRAAQRAGLHQVPVIIREVPRRKPSNWRWSRTYNAKTSTLSRKLKAINTW